MKPLFYSGILLLLIFCSCHKELSVEPAGNGSNPQGNTSDTGTYFPSTAGSTWTYSVNINLQIDTLAILQELDSIGLTVNELDSLGLTLGSLDSLFNLSTLGLTDTSFQKTITCTGHDTLIGGLHFVVYNVSDGTQGYMYKNNGQYTFWGPLLGSSFSGVPSYVQQQFLFLEDNQSVGAEWQDTLNIDGLINVYNFVILAKGITKVVNGVTYNNVIEVALSLNLPQEFNISYSVIDMYYALNTGLIEAASVPSASGITEDEELTSVSIK